jgi:hypothetical protein
VVPSEDRSQLRCELGTYTLYAENGSSLWTDSLTTNIPTASGREIGHGIIATNSGTTAQTIAHLDFMNLSIPRTLIR